MQQIPTERIDIIVVDDRDNWRNIIAEILEPLSYSTLAIGNFENAKFAIENIPLKLAILDLNMEDGDEDDRGGLELLQLMDLLGLDSKVLMVTGYGSEEDEEIASNNNRVVEFIRKKDIDPSSFREIVQNTIHSLEM